MIELDPRLKTPLYEQLYAALADEIRRGDRAPGTPLPGRQHGVDSLNVAAASAVAFWQLRAK